jgi:ATP-dependent Clp protease adapter protein ClpS
MSTETIIEKKVTVKEPKEPSKYKVVVCNDDVTPVDFVVAMLVQYSSILNNKHYS